MNSVKRTLNSIANNFKVNETELFQKMPSGETIFEYALKSGITIICYRFSKIQSLDLILKYEAYELLKVVDIKTLLKTNKSNLNECYLETILKAFKKDQIINISYINPVDNATSLNDIADVYLLYAKYGLVDYLPLLDTNLLLLTELKNSKEDLKEKLSQFTFRKESRSTLLEIMLNKDKVTTVNKVLNNNLKKDIDIAIILQLYGIDVINIEYGLKPNNYINNIVKSINKKYDDIKLTEEENRLLKTLYDIFIVDSDEEVVNTLINSYKIQLSKKNPNTIIEIKKLIELKLHGKPSYIRRGSNFYAFFDNGIEIKNCLTDTLNHEMGHALFHNLTDGSVPYRFWNIISRIIENKNTLKKLNEYSLEGDKINKELSKFASDKYDGDFIMLNKIVELYEIRDKLSLQYDYRLDKQRLELEKETYDLRKEISEFLLKSKEEKIREYKEKGYSEEDLEVLFANTFTVKEYAIMHKKIQKRELIDTINSSLLAPMRSMGDIFDAIYQGKFLSGKLFFEGKKIKPVTGHGLFYYNFDKDMVFNEILADYRTIIMSENSEEYIEKLRYYVGDELVDFLDYYYNNTLLKVSEVSKAYGR